MQVLEKTGNKNGSGISRKIPVSHSELDCSGMDSRPNPQRLRKVAGGRVIALRKKWIR
jgi:hypothetical protein